MAGSEMYAEEKYKAKSKPNAPRRDTSWRYVAGSSGYAPPKLLTKDVHSKVGTERKQGPSVGKKANKKLPSDQNRYKRPNFSEKDWHYVYLKSSCRSPHEPFSASENFVTSKEPESRKFGPRIKGAWIDGLQYGASFQKPFLATQSIGTELEASVFSARTTQMFEGRGPTLNSRTRPVELASVKSGEELPLLSGELGLQDDTASSGMRTGSDYEGSLTSPTGRVLREDLRASMDLKSPPDYRSVSGRKKSIEGLREISEDLHELRSTFGSASSVSRRTVWTPVGPQEIRTRTPGFSPTVLDKLAPAIREHGELGSKTRHRLSARRQHTLQMSRYQKAMVEKCDFTVPLNRCLKSQGEHHAKRTSGNNCNSRKATPTLPPVRRRYSQGDGRDVSSPTQSAEESKETWDVLRHESPSQRAGIVGASPTNEHAATETPGEETVLSKDTDATTKAEKPSEGNTKEDIRPSPEQVKTAESGRTQVETPKASSTVEESQPTSSTAVPVDNEAALDVTNEAALDVANEAVPVLTQSVDPTVMAVDSNSQENEESEYEKEQVQLPHI